MSSRPQTPPSRSISRWSDPQDSPKESSEGSDPVLLGHSCSSISQGTPQPVLRHSISHSNERTTDSESYGDPLSQLRDHMCATDANACCMIASDEAELVRFLKDCGGCIEGQDGAAERIRRAVKWRRQSEESLSERRFETPAMYVVPRNDPMPSGVRKRDAKERAVVAHLAQLGSYASEELVSAFFSSWNAMLRRVQRDACVSVAVCLSGMGEAQSVLTGSSIQRVSACLSQYYPHRLKRLILYPCPQGGLVEKKVREMVEALDMGRVMQYGELVLCPSKEHAASVLEVPLSDLDSPELPRTEKAETTPLVYTPWCYEGVAPGISLDDELEVFTRFVLPSEQERSKRNAIRALVQEAISGIEGGRACTVKLVGPAALNLFTPFCPMQMSCNLSDREAAIGALHNYGLTIALQDCCEQHPSGYEHCSIRVRAPCGTKIELILDGKGQEARAAVSQWRECINRTPAITGAFCVLRCILGQAGNGAGTKGVGPTTLIAMICHVASNPQQQRRKRSRKGKGEAETGGSPGQVGIRELVSQFLKYYSAFDYASQSIHPTLPTTPRTPEHLSAKMSVLDPCGRVNWAAGVQFPEIFKQQLRYCAQALAKAECKSGASQRRQTLRTPLSQLLSHNPLWPRCRELLSQKPVFWAAPQPVAQTEESRPQANSESSGQSSPRG